MSSKHIPKICSLYLNSFPIMHITIATLRLNICHMKINSIYESTLLPPLSSLLFVRLSDSCTILSVSLVVAIFSNRPPLLPLVALLVDPCTEVLVVAFSGVRRDTDGLVEDLGVRAALFSKFALIPCKSVQQ